MAKFLNLFAVVLLLGSVAAGASLEILPAHLRPDPFGGTVDQGAAARTVTLKSARGGYLSFHLVVKVPGTYSLSFAGDLTADIFREWFHLADKRYYPDALIPVKLPYRSQIPEPDNRIEKQTAQAFWVDIWIPRDARPGSHRCRVILEGREELPLNIEVLAATVPAEDVVTIDHNSYGTSWIPGQYPKAAIFPMIHAHHRIFYEHRGTYHQLGYGHGGKVGPEFAPVLEGSGRRKHIANWELFDRHYGPLLDGSAFAGTRRGPHPIPFVYLPINPEWPASYLWWGEPGYETEFVNVVSEMERHFREKGWTHTRFELFFNHKKRYMGFSWDGDEVRFPRDNQYFLEYGRLLKKALPARTPVKFVFRADVSWDMEEQFKSLAGTVNMWVSGGSELSWFQDSVKMLKQRGDIVWFYGGPPRVQDVSATITRVPLQAWLWSIDGFVHWLVVSPGSDPWFRFDGGGTALVYPGTRFGITEPIPSIRLKLQRNCLEDLALLDSFRESRPIEWLKSEAAQRYNHSKPADWWNPRPAFANKPPYEWTNSDFASAEKRQPALEASAWDNVHQFILQLASEAK